MEKTFAIGTYSEDQEKVGGDASAQDWLEEKTGDPEVIKAKGKGQPCSISFATSGIFSNPGGWTTPVSLPVAGWDDVPAADLANAMLAGFEDDDENSVILVKTTYSSGDGEFYAQIDSTDANDWVQVS